MEGFGYGDIIVIGAIAAFIILRYRAMLGEQSNVPRSEINDGLQDGRRWGVMARQAVVQDGVRVGCRHLAVRIVRLGDAQQFSGA